MKAMMVREKVKRFLESGEMSQNELARKSGVATSTLSDFKKERNELTNEELKSLLRVIDPNAFNPRVVGASHRALLLKRGFDLAEISIIADEIRGAAQVSG